jgi:glutamate dehydrogenase/leucine dehydrogenase
VDAELVRILDAAYDSVQALAVSEEVPLRMATYMLGIRGVAEATMLRGLE